MEVGSIGSEVNAGGLNELLESVELEVGLILVNGGVVLIDVPAPAIKVKILEGLIGKDRKGGVENGGGLSD